MTDNLTISHLPTSSNSLLGQVNHQANFKHQTNS